MRYACSLLMASALCAFAAPAAHAATHHRHHPAKPAKPTAEPAKVDSAIMAELAALRSQVATLQARLDKTEATTAATSATVAQTQVQVGSLSQSVRETPAVAKAAAKTEVATAITAEHAKGYTEFKGIRLTPGGFLELAGIYRQHFQGNDISSSFSVPFPSNSASHVGEGRFTARQSRVSFLAQGNANPHTVLSMYGEFDFQGGAQTANSNESNSYNPRIRHLYGTIDWNAESSGVHLLAGQTWSLVTLNTGGITPRKELTPAVIEAQYVPGFTWARQPQVRLTVDTADHHLWAAVSAENPATTFAGATPPGLTYSAPAGSGFASANTLSLNSTPDFVGKVAYEGAIAGHTLHLEGYGLLSSFVAHLNGAGNTTHAGYGFGGGAVLQVVPKVFDLQFSGMAGKGIGRYGTAGLPEVAFAADGSIHPIREVMLLGGAMLHPTPMLDVYLYAGREQQFAQTLGGAYGIGLATANNSGCLIEGGVCNGNTRRIEQLTGGLWQKIYSGTFGRAQVGLQWEYTERQLFADGQGNAPSAHQNVGMISFRYYPF